jgi:hypothetical protein
LENEIVVWYDDDDSAVAACFFKMNI